MRAFKKGEPFMHVESEGYVPGPDELAEMEEHFQQTLEVPTFSEAYLYPRVGKDDARFILGVADEYAKVIRVLGEEKVYEILASPEFEPGPEPDGYRVSGTGIVSTSR